MLWERLLRRINYRWAIVVVVLVTLAVHVGWASHHHPHQTVPLALLSALPLLGLRRNPLAVLGVVLVALVATDLAYRWSNPFPVWLSLFVVARWRPRRTSLLAAAVTLVAVLASHEISHPASVVARIVSVSVA